MKISNVTDTFQPTGQSRVEWVDYAKGFCIILVVMMHSTLGVGKATGDTGYMHWLVEFARPFRMPDFFLISGLFLAAVIDRPWARYFDRKVVHFFYFYVLWVTIQYAFKAPAWIGEGQTMAQVATGYLQAFVQPFGTLWFIYALPVFFLVARWAERFDWRLVLAIAALLEILPVHTGSVLIDEFASRFVYFYAGFKLAPMIFRFAEWSINNASRALILLGGWAVLNGILVFSPVPQPIASLIETMSRTAPASFSDLPLVSLGLGSLGAAAIILTSALLSRVRWMDALRYIGANSIVIYLGFFLPMGISRVILLKFAPFLDIGTVSLLVTTSGVIGAIIMYWTTLFVGWGSFLYKRPRWAVVEHRLEKLGRKSVVAPAE